MNHRRWAIGASARSVTGMAAVMLATGCASSMLAPTAGTPPASTMSAIPFAVIIAADPATLPFGGGVSTITATVVDSAHNPLTTVPVSFKTTGGNLTLSAAKTDVKGQAQVTLSAVDTATVTVTAGTVSSVMPVSVLPRPQPVVMMTASPNAVAQAPVTFAITVTPGVGSNTTIQSVSMDFGDGTVLPLGAVSGAAIVAQHVYRTGGTYTAIVTATDSLGGVTAFPTVVAVAFSAPLSVTLAAVPGAAFGTAVPTQYIVTLTATVVKPEGTVISSYVWDFGDNSPPFTSTSNQIQHLFTAGDHTVTVVVTPAGGAGAVSGLLYFTVPAK